MTFAAPHDDIAAHLVAAPPSNEGWRTSTESGSSPGPGSGPGAVAWKFTRRDLHRLLERWRLAEPASLKAAA